MLRVECEQCKSPYQVDERRIPAAGLKMRCPKCGHAFVVKAESGTPLSVKGEVAAPAPATAPAPPARNMKQTMIGVGTMPAKTAAEPPRPPPAVTMPELPASKPKVPNAAPVPPPSKPLSKEEAFEFDDALPALVADLPATRVKPPLPSAQKPPVPVKPAAPASPIATPSEPYDDLPIPAVASDLPARAKAPPPRPAPPRAVAPLAPKQEASDLPVAAVAKPKPPAPAAKFAPIEIDLPQAKPVQRAAAPVPAFGAVDSFDFEIDLPSKAADLPVARAAAAVTDDSFEMDLPSRSADLPVARGADLPIAAAELPVARRAPISSTGFDAPFGEIDFPTVSDGLPELASGLPQVASALPSPAAAYPQLANALPQVANALPQVANALPQVASALPATANAYPQLAGSLPAPVDQGRFMPSARAGSLAPDLGDLGEGLGEFGELDLPPPVQQKPSGRPFELTDSLPPGPSLSTSRPSVSSKFAPVEAAEMSDFELPLTEAAPRRSDRAGAPIERGEKKAAGGMAFGEVDLGGGDESAPSSGGEATFLASSPPPAPMGTAAPAELSRGDEAALPIASTTARQRPAARKRSRARLVFLGMAALVAIGGGLLQLTPYGAFGYLAISDSAKAGEYARITAEDSANVRKRLAVDTYGEARAALDGIAAAHNQNLRAQSLSAMAALMEYEAQLRFGNDVDRGARAKQWLSELPPNTEVKYANVASALQSAASGDLPRARHELDLASKRDLGDPIQQDIAYARGEVELRASDASAAVVAFNRALQLQPGAARAHHGLARAYLLADDRVNASKEIEATLAASKAHAGARLLRAMIAWEKDKDEKAALADLASVIEGEFKVNASPREQGAAFAERGWIHASRMRPADARTAFEAALKLDGRNVRALIGQGELLYSESRFTEALTRFDTAVQADPTSVTAIVSDAKAKLALERLADAKTQLATARALHPKDPKLAYWLGKAEEALGNKPAAEAEYTAAIDLVDPTQVDAVAPYVALSALLASEGRVKDAQAKLDDARGKLPDSAAMQRALAEVAAAQGQYDAAIAHYKSALEKEPTDLDARFHLGITFRRMRKMDDASAEFDKVLAIDKDYPGLALERGLLYEESGDIEKALLQFQSALSKAPEDPDLQLRVGAAYTASERPAEAIPMLRNVLAKRPTNAEASHYLGRALFLQGGTSAVEARRFLKRAVELDPNKPEYHLYMAWAANSMEPADLGTAKEEIEKALALDKLLADGYWQRGVLERKSTQCESAIVDFKRALELRPTRNEAHAGLAECYEDKNDLGNAFVEWSKAVAKDDKQPFWRFRFGRVLLERGNVGEAVKHLAFAATEADKALDHGEAKLRWHWDVQFSAAQAFQRSGKTSDAIERYKRFMDLSPSSSPDRRDAILALAQLGAPFTPKL
jgi:predicted Zn finger-like uncharacterized protein